MKTPKGFFTYFHHEEVLGALSDAEAGRLYKALLHYGNTGELPDFDGNKGLSIAFTLFRVEIDYNFERYQEICEKRSEAGKKSAESKKAKRATREEEPTARLVTFTAADLMRDYQRQQNAANPTSVNKSN